MYGVCGFNENLEVVRVEDLEGWRAGRGTRIEMSTGSMKKMPKKELWDTYWNVNQTKLSLMLLRCKVSTSRREQRWFKFVCEKWAESEQEVDWNAPHVVYMACIMNCSWEYVGETKLTLRKRGQTHLQQTWRRGGRQRLYSKLRQLGPHKLIWLPLKSWDREASKFERLEAEAEMIWTRNPKLNAIGAKNWQAEDRRRFEGELVFPKRRQFHLVKSLMDKQARGLNAQEREVRRAEKEKQARTRLEAKSRVCQTVARLARRPLAKGTNF
jgi:hypothetical protein